MVTGSHIRGVESSASPVYRFDRNDILQSGLSTTEQFLQTLPQNFAGGNSFSTVGGALGGDDSNFNYGGGTGVNLRGLGNDSTLVLVNGRRVAPAGVGNFVDISMIPIGAVERMDVLADGASAIYGSDAVAGVVNILLRKDFEGAESRMRYGTAAGGGDELQLGQVFGTHWGSGSAMLTYEYFERAKLDSEERGFTRTFADKTHLLPAEDRHSALASMEQRIGDRQIVFANGSYSKRANEFWFNGGDLQTISEAQVKQYGGTIGTAVDVGASWRIDIAGSYSTNDTLYDISYAGFGSSLDHSSAVWSVDAKADGALLDTAGGMIRLALGGQYRREAFEEVRSTRYKGDRNVSAVFAELFVPLIGDDNSARFAQRLELTFAGRYESYSDFGSTFDPKFGVLWSPALGINLRATVGTSFRAPLLSELQPVLDVMVFELADPLSNGIAPTLFLQGGTGLLGPEQSTTWTAGVDFEPQSFESLRLSLTYFDIDFHDRISQPIPNDAVFSALSWEDRYAVAINRSPELARVLELYAEPAFLNFNNVPPESIVAIIDNRPMNLARRAEQGLDLALSYGRDAWGGRLTSQLAGTYLFSLDEQVTQTTPTGSLLNTLFYPVDLRLRGNLGWAGQDWGVTASLSYVDDYRDRREGRESRIGSWTTLDLTARYTGFAAPYLRGTEMALSVLNVFDKDPPFVNNNGLDFDATNANAIGRFIALQLTHAW